MLRGFATFKCPECGHEFEGPDIELGATVYTMSLDCPKCGCPNCQPKNGISNLLGKDKCGGLWDLLGNLLGKK